MPSSHAARDPSAWEEPHGVYFREWKRIGWIVCFERLFPLGTRDDDDYVEKVLGRNLTDARRLAQPYHDATEEHRKVALIAEYVVFAYGQTTGA